MTARFRSHSPARVLSSFAAIGTAAIVSACAPAMFTRPLGPGTPANDGAAIWRDASADCRDVRTYRAMLDMSGRVAGHRIPHVKLGVAVDAQGSVAVEARVVGPLLFALGGNTARATLLLSDGNRVVTAPAADIMEALIGVKLTPMRLLGVLTGCVSPAGTVVRASRYGDVVDVTTSDADVYVVRAGDRWRTRAGAFDDMVVNYADARRDAHGMPVTLAIGSTAVGAARLAIELRVGTATVNADLDPSLFVRSTPPGATPMSIEDLRANGPLGGP